MANPPTTQIQMRDGRYVDAQTNFGQGPQHPQKFLIVIQYYDGDVAQAEDLANIICDLERVRNKDADILLFGRHDAQPFPAHIRQKLEAKFDRVHVATCRSRDGTSYPFASNCMWYDLVALLGQYPVWNKPYFAFINLETDCVPVHPGWIKELIMEFKIAQVHDKVCIGHINPTHATPHMNGVGVYPIDMFYKVPGNRLAGGPLDVAFDLYHARSILPIAMDTPLIMMEFRRATITAADLFKAHKGGIEPALYHGVKDSSAREAVRARYITFSEKKDLSRTTVFTYFDPGSSSQAMHMNEVLELWKQAWASRGWNPVVLRRIDAAKNPRYQAMLTAISHFPYAGDKQEQENGFMRWLALESVGGGLLVRYDEVPNAYTPDKLTLDSQLKGAGLSTLIGMMVDYTPPMELEDVTDEDVIDLCRIPPRYSCVAYGREGYKTADAVSFTDSAVANSPARGKQKSDAIRDYLQEA